MGAPSLLDSRFDGEELDPWRSPIDLSAEVIWLSAAGEERHDDEVSERRFQLQQLEEKAKKEAKQKDYWQAGFKNQVVARIHQRRRTAMFNPRWSTDLPIPLEMLAEERSAAIKFKDGTEAGPAKDRWCQTLMVERQDQAQDQRCSRASS